MTLFQYTGNAVQTTLAAPITNSDLSISLGSATGWPDGAGSFVFVATIGDPANGDTLEKVLVASRSTGTLTISQRGYEGTSAQAWAQGTLIRHTLSATAMQEASDHIADSTIHMSAAIHAAIVHTQAMMGVGSVGQAQLLDGSVGAGEIIAGAVGSTELAANAVIAGKIAVDAVVAGTIADAAIDDHLLFSADTQPFIVQATDPGAVGANKVWLDTTARLIKVRNVANDGWDIYGDVLVPWTTYTPALGTGMTEGGTGIVRTGEYMVANDTCVFNATWNPGTLGNLASGNNLSLGLPPVTPNYTQRRGVGGRVHHVSLGEFAGAGIITSALAGFATNFAYFNGVFDATHPINWGNPGDGEADFDMFGFFRVA